LKVKCIVYLHFFIVYL